MTMGRAHAHAAPTSRASRCCSNAASRPSTTAATKEKRDVRARDLLRLRSARPGLDGGRSRGGHRSRAGRRLAITQPPMPGGAPPAPDGPAPPTRHKRPWGWMAVAGPRPPASSGSGSTPSTSTRTSTTPTPRSCTDRGGLVLSDRPVAPARRVMALPPAVRHPRTATSELAVDCRPCWPASGVSVSVAPVRD